MLEVLYLDKAREGMINLYDDVDYLRFKLTFAMIVRAFEKETITSRDSDDDIVLFQKLFKEVFDSDIARALLDDVDDDQYFQLSREPYRVRVRDEEVFPGPRDNYKEIINYIAVYFGSSSKNILKLINNCRLYLLGSDKYDIEKGLRLNEEYGNKYLIQLEKLIKNVELDIENWQKEFYGKVREKRTKELHKKLDHYKKLQRFWQEFLEHLAEKKFERAIIYPILYSVINMDVILFDMKGKAAFSLNPVTRIEEGKKYIICSYLNPDLFLGIIHTDHPVDNEDEDEAKERDLLCTKLNTDYLNIDDVTFEFEFCKERKQSENAVLCRIKNRGKYLRSLGAFRRSYLSLTDDAKKDKTVWKIEWCDSLDTPYISIRSSSSFPYDVFSIDIPNGNSYVEDLLCWLFISNGSGSQRFFLYEKV